jgi:hypothetical protein
VNGYEKSFKNAVKWRQLRLPCHTTIMTRWSKGKFFLALLYVGLLFSVGTHLYSRFQYFEGDLFLVPGQATAIAFSDQERSGSLALRAQNVPADLVAPEHAARLRQRFGPDAVLKTAEMDFFLRLDTFEVIEEYPPKEMLEAEIGRARESIPALPGAEAVWGGLRVTLGEVQPWTGLVRDASSGRPMAKLTLLRDAEASDPSLLTVGAWAQPAPDVFLRLQWFPDQVTAAESLKESIESESFARWGVAEENSVHWLYAFLPGTGLTLRDDTKVTLLGRDPGTTTRPPRIAVEITRKGGFEEVILSANEPKGSPEIKYEDPGREKYLVLVHAWRGTDALVGLYEHGKLLDSKILKEGESLSLADLQVRLDQVMAQAVAADSENSEVRQLRVHVENHGEIGLREGDVARVADMRLCYRRIPQPPRLRYRGTVLDRDGREQKTFSLGPSDSFRQGAWRFRQTVDHGDASHLALVQGRRTLGGPGRVFGLLLVFGGSVGLIIVRFLGPRMARGKP